MNNGMMQRRNNVIPMAGYGARSRGMSDIFYNPQDQSWYEIRDGVPVRVSGTPPRGNVGAPTSTPTNSNTNQWLNLVNTLGNQALTIYQNSQALAAQRLAAEQAGTMPGAGGGQGLTGLVNQVTTFASNNPLLVAAGVAGVFLLMMNPPSKRR